MYTQEQLDIELLKNTNEGILRTISDMQSAVKSQIAEIRQDMKSQFHLLIGLILGIYGVIGSAVLAKAFGAF
jgi:hypothetical protein